MGLDTVVSKETQDIWDQRKIDRYLEWKSSWSSNNVLWSRKLSEALKFLKKIVQPLIHSSFSSLCSSLCCSGNSNSNSNNTTNNTCNNSNNAIISRKIFFSPKFFFVVVLNYASSWTFFRLKREFTNRKSIL